ncbi:MAG: hypothetical protein KF745_13735 [Phycisphaeraceae bacterium]|nr:hypothetical protein [Phycisphaeraceae bacterium]
MLIGIGIGVLAIIAVMLALDLGLWTRRDRDVTPGEAAASVSLWVLAAIGCGLLLARIHGQDWADVIDETGLRISARDIPQHIWLQYASVYFTQLMLSLDSVVILAAVFAELEIRGRQGRRLLLWIVLLSLMVRTSLIGAGSVIVATPWGRWVCAGLLIATTVRLLVVRRRDSNIARRLLLGMKRGIRRSSSARTVSPAMAVLIAVGAEAVFSIDSVPAALAVSPHPYIGIVGSVMAVLAMRSLYFAIGPAMSRLRYVRLSIILVLVMLTVKVLYADYRPEVTAVTLLGSLGVVGIGFGASLLRLRRGAPRAIEPTPLEDIEEAALAVRRNLRKVAVLIAGTMILLLGVVIAPLPGPGFVILAPIGLAVLATEFLWARALLQQMKSRLADAQKTTERLASRSSPWLVPLVFAGYTAGIFVLAHLMPPRGTRFVWLGSIGGYLLLTFWAARVLLLARARSAESASKRQDDPGVPPGSGLG